MKKLLKLMACALAVSFGLTACDNGEESHHPFDSGYQPKGSQLNTSHRLVGQMYGVDGVVDDPTKAQGIVFAVSKAGDTAYLVSFTDAMVVGASNALTDPDKYCFSIERGYCALSVKWGLTIPSEIDSTRKQVEVAGQMKDTLVITQRAVINSVDGEFNTNKIIECFTKAVLQDTTVKIPVVYAAQLCRDYYRREWSKKKDDGTGSSNDKLGEQWRYTQGEWYLPSIEELGDLMKNRDKINKKYGDASSNFINDNEYFFMTIGGDGHAYWSSSEFNVQSAWYCLSRVGDGTGYSGNKRYGYFQKDDRQNMYVRPIRKAPIK
ncbi:MAG: DUF1566 domain-containing protein [Bacteroides sp.]|nr:DUF1566 domain-containing protein [Bacteroides sp.]